MPRSGSGVASPPPGTTATPNTTILSAAHNSLKDDIYAILNQGWPVSLGGTGGTTKQGSVDSLFDGTTYIKDGNLIIADEGDTTKRLKFETSEIDSGQTRTITAQDRNGTMALSTDIWWRPNIIVNGSMIDSQEKGNTLGTTNGYFAADQFGLYFTAAGAGLSIQRVQSSRSLAGGVNKLEVKCTTAKASLGATDFVMISQPIEGSRPDFVAAEWGTADAKPFVFRVDQTLPAGTYHIHAQNSAANRHIAIPFTATGTEAVIEVAIPGDTAGTWLTGDGEIGVVIDIVLAAGATLTGGSASTWGGATFYAASTQFNFLSSTANTGLITDVGLKLDTEETGVYGPYDVGEVHPDYNSYRYIRPNGAMAGVASGTNTFGATCDHLGMAKSPTFLTAGGGITITDGYAASFTQSSFNCSASNQTRNASTLAMGNFLGLTNGRAYYWRAVTGLLLNARLA